MSTSSLLAALVALIGCGSGAPEATPRPAPVVGASAAAAVAGCERYRTAIPQAWEICLKRAAVTLETVEGMTEVCALAGAREAECHGAWVDRQRARGRFDDEVLLAACLPDYDCVLQRLDATPLDDVVEQEKRCIARAALYTGVCVGHALDRWVRSVPSEEEIARVVQGPFVDKRQLGRKIGLMVVCQKRGACPVGPSSVVTPCARSVVEATANPGHCKGYAR